MGHHFRLTLCTWDLVIQGASGISPLGVAMHVYSCGEATFPDLYNGKKG